ncbi:hypothetical protein JOM56_004691 [Amanita muscaria]
MNDEYLSGVIQEIVAPPLPLMQVEELPECYQTDEPFENKETEEVPEVEGREEGTSPVITTGSAIIDDPWAMVLEEGEDLQELSECAQEKERRATNEGGCLNLR